jgi:hypothetical protein
MFADEQRDDEKDLNVTPEEIEDLDAPDEESDAVRGGMAPVISTKGCTCSKDCLST